MQSLKIHALFITLAVILIGLVLVMKQSASPPPATTETVGDVYIRITSASYGLNCVKTTKITPNTPENTVRPVGNFADFSGAASNTAPTKDNVLSAVSELCNGKPRCTFPVDAQTLQFQSNDPYCLHELQVRYQCFSFDRIWEIVTATGKGFDLDCVSQVQATHSR